MPSLRAQFRRRIPRRLRGAASLVVLLLLLMATLLVAAWAQRNVLSELRIAANQVRSAVAFEAAEAGLAWAQAVLNAGEAIGPDCRPVTGAGTLMQSFAGRYLGPADASGRFTPRSRGAAGGAAPLQVLCAHLAAGWSCNCPDAAAPTLATAQDNLTPAFLLQWVAAPQPGTVQLVSTGCSHLARPCLPQSTERADASSRLRVTFALLAAIATPPAATLMALGELNAGAAALGLHNADALSGGLVAQAGGSIVGTALRVRTAPGAAAAAALLSQDQALAALTPAQLFSRHFGPDLPQWLQQPGVRTLECHGDCSAELLDAVATQAQIARIGVRGDLRLAGDVQVGSVARPVLLVVDGDLQLSGPVQIHGLVHARSLQWDELAEGEGGLLHGAVLLSQGYRGNGAPDLVYDPSLIARLKRQSGTWVRVPGSWRDF